MLQLNKNLGQVEQVEHPSEATGGSHVLHFAVNFLRQSNNVYKLKELLGHKDISMTAMYLRCLPVDELRGDVEKMSIDNLI